MIQEIRYNGFKANPSDYESTDGELAMSLGVVHEDGALKPVLPPKELFTLDETTNVVFIHKTSNFTHYIILDENDNSILFTRDGTEKVQVHQFGGKVKSVNSLGNTLVVLTASAIHYLLWKGEKYAYLGDHMPEIKISFGLDAYKFNAPRFTVPGIGWVSRPEGIFIKEENVNDLTNAVLGQVNKMIKENVEEDGCFIFPFFVRYAYRLYDGSLVMHSAPVLMIPATDDAIFCSVVNVDDEGMHIVSYGVKAYLDYALMNPEVMEQLENWKDIIRSVDIFISAPIYTYDQSGKCEKLSESTICNGFTVALRVVGYEADGMFHPGEADGTPVRKYVRYETKDILVPKHDIKYTLLLPKKDKEKVFDEIKDKHLFYLVKSLDIGKLKTERTHVGIHKDELATLLEREVMTDDYDSHDVISAGYSFAYNSRMNITNIKKKVFKGYNPSALFTYCNGAMAEGYETYLKTARVYYFIKQDGKEIVVQSENAQFGYDMPFVWLYYPNINAYKAVLESGGNHYSVKLERHGTLNGAYFFEGWEVIDMESNKQPGTPIVTMDKTLEMPNKIYTSEVNNPFYFPVSGINTVGTGTILGISSAAKALSQGQFGQFPLYAFSTDGVWALEVSATGTYSAKQPVTRDVCINTDSITQIDSAVLFATSRGIMLISGSEAVCLSDSINSRDLFALSDLPKADKLVSLFNERAAEDEQITLENSSLLPFRDFLTDCRMVYDYANQRIIVYNPSVSYAYVYSLKSKAWGMMHCDITDNVNAYPDALAMVSGGKLVNFSLSDADRMTALVVTRPFKLGHPDVLKTIDTIIQRGFFKKDHVSQILYGSCDLFNWHIVWSSTDKYLRGFRGTPYKYFRLALICKLDKAESIYGCSVQFTPRFTDKPR